MPKLLNKYSSFQSVLPVTKQQLHALPDPCQQKKTLAPSQVRVVTVIQTLACLLLKDKLELFSSCKYTKVILLDKMQITLLQS